MAKKKEAAVVANSDQPIEVPKRHFKTQLEVANCDGLPLLPAIQYDQGNRDIIQHVIEQLIINVRGVQVMADRDLAMLYGVETRRLNEQVKRNIERFPEDFMFQLTKEEFHAYVSAVERLRSQIATAKDGTSLKDMGLSLCAITRLMVSAETILALLK